MPLPVPAVLKELASFLQRAKEVEHVDPVMTYWCKYYAAHIGITKGTGNAEAQTFLLSLMDELEQLKATLSDRDAVTNDTVGQTYIENFALQIFLGADNEDREASKFLEVLQVFGPLEPEMQTKIKYAKWKGAQIWKALRQGTTPTPGPDKATMTPEETLQQLSTPEQGGQDTADAPKEEPGPFAASPTTTRDETGHSSAHERPQVPSHTNVAPVHVIKASTKGEAPHGAGEPRAPTADTERSTPEPVTESGLSVGQISHIQKLCRWASSALDYEDVETARTQLQHALALLDGAARN
ncbi:hypothetical protein MNAN1_002331 [Malassezia nana]|uniref:Vacuolar protein sorting-associated protein VTA1 n=1 Tax=Malassezia nana TaxID=180528 RepID=A0AAF0EMR5_9BASI|nr:hypothetical protein MNAN1_002331 [Malassezia nana]